MAQQIKQIPIEKFGSKLMISSKSINNIPSFYLADARNARIYDGGIGPRKGKQFLTNSVIGTKNRGGFVMGGKLYQIANSKIYKINETTGVQTEIATLGYDATTDILVYEPNIAIITSTGKDLILFNGTTVATITTDPTSFPTANTGIIEFCRGYSFVASNNVLYISRPITAANPEYSYDFTGTGAQNITYETTIRGLYSTLNGLYVFTEDKIEFLGANALQNVSGSATFISTPIGEANYPISNLCIAGAGDKIFYLSQNLQIKTVNYIPGITSAQIGTLSTRPVISIKELLNTFDSNQADSFAYYNQNEENIQFHLKSSGGGFNNQVLVYDLINDTWGIDSNKNYNYIVKQGSKYYGFSDINTSIYEDGVGNSDAGIPIPFRIETQNMIYGTALYKLFVGFFTSGGIGFLTDLVYTVIIDQIVVFVSTIKGSEFGIQGLGEIGGEAVGEEAIGGGPEYISKLAPFDKIADQGRIFKNGKRISFVIESNSQIQDFIIDILGASLIPTNFTDKSNKF